MDPPLPSLQLSVTPGWPVPLCQLCSSVTLSPVSLGRPLQDLKIHQIASDGFITTFIKASENTDSEGEVREAIRQPSITSGLDFQAWVCWREYQKEETSGKFTAILDIVKGNTPEC